MKRAALSQVLTVLIFSLLLMPACRKGPGEAVSFKPEKPRPGQPLEILFRAEGTLLEKSSEVGLWAYVYVKGMPRLLNLPMTRKGSTWRAALNPQADCRGAVLKFVSGDAQDANGFKGYVLPMYDAQGSLVPGHRAGLAEALASWGNFLAGMDIDKIRALSLLEEDFAAHPEIKSDYAALYFTLLYQVRKREGQEIILKELAELAAKPDPSTDDLMLLINWYTRLQLPDLAKRFLMSLREREPNGELVQAERFQEFYRERNLKKKRDLLEAFQRNFPSADKMVAQFHFFMAGAYREAELYDQAKTYLETHPFAGSWQACTGLAWTMVRNGEDLLQAEQVAALAVDRARSERQNAAETRPAYLTEGEWVRQKNASLGEALDAQGFIRLRLQKHEGGLLALREAAGLLEGKNRVVNEHYAEALIKAAAPAAALAEIEQMLKTGRGTSRMKALLREAYLSAKEGEEGFSGFLARVEEEARGAMEAELRLRVRSEPAPGFSLQDLKGATVSLSGLQGRVVIVDFWATWSQPCLDSFPAWRRALEKYRDDAEVRFVFINSWERVADRKKNAADFLETNGYDLPVLLDSRDEVIDMFRVNGIPTSFVIDGRGRIRFRNEGFQGDADNLFEELSLMIDMAR